MTDKLTGKLTDKLTQREIAFLNAQCGTHYDLDDFVDYSLYDNRASQDRELSETTLYKLMVDYQEIRDQIKNKIEDYLQHTEQDDFFM